MNKGFYGCAMIERNGLKKAQKQQSQNSNGVGAPRSGFTLVSEDILACCVLTQVFLPSPVPGDGVNKPPKITRARGS